MILTMSPTGCQIAPACIRFNADFKKMSGGRCSAQLLYYSAAFRPHLNQHPERLRPMASYPPHKVQDRRANSQFVSRWSKLRVSGLNRLHTFAIGRVWLPIARISTKRSYAYESLCMEDVVSFSCLSLFPSATDNFHTALQNEVYFVLNDAISLPQGDDRVLMMKSRV